MFTSPQNLTAVAAQPVNSQPAPDYAVLAQDWSIAFFSVLFFYFLGLAVGSVVNTIRSS